MINLKVSRLRRAKKSRINILLSDKHRLCVYKSNQHIYAQIIHKSNTNTITSASTLESEYRITSNSGNNIKAAEYVGIKIAERAKELGINEVAFDRSGYKYHGKIKALAEAARNAGIKF